MKPFALLAAALLAFSCAGAPEAPESPPAERSPGEESPPGEAAEEPREAFPVSQEEYSLAFGQIEQFIEDLNRIIRSEDYEGWLEYLSEEYIRTTSDPAYLRQQSEKPLLKQANIQLRDLRDYFLHVVVPSRTQATLYEIEFVDENQVKAIALLRGTRVILYLLDRTEGQWKIGVW